MFRLIRTIYKAITYGLILSMGWFYTIILKFLLVLNNVKFGKGLFTFNAIPDLQINRQSGLVLFGENFLINNYTDVSWFCKSKIIVLKDASLIIGDNSGINGTLLYCSSHIEIGNHVKIGGGTRIFDTNFHSLDWRLRRDIRTDIDTRCSPIKIEDDVFIGAGCIIEKGVTIGARSIIAAGSIVVKDIPSDCIAGGNPCKVIKYIEKS